jgi:hypothetical protein
MDSPRQWAPLDEHDDGQRSGTSTPTHTHEFSRLLSPATSDNMLAHRPTRSHSAGSFVKSPLNPAAPMSPSQPRRLSSHGSMILYRLADDKTALLPPRFTSARNSLISNSGDSFLSFKSESKYPSALLHRTSHGIVPYEYDPTFDQLEPPDDEDQLHDPRSDIYLKADSATLPWRGILNVGLLILIILGLLTLFIFYPVYTWYTQLSKFAAEANNLHINATGQSSPLSHFSFLTFGCHVTQANLQYCENIFLILSMPSLVSESNCQT